MRDRRPRYAVRGALLAVLILLLVPGFFVGQLYDDYQHAIQLRSGPPGLLRLFVLYDTGGPGPIAEGRYLGVVPWWGSDALSVRFFRPLSSLDLAFDHLFFEPNGFGSHVHGALWFALLLFLAHRLFVQVLGDERAYWCTFLYGVSSCHVMPVSWMAVRHSHVTAVLVVASLLLLLRALREPTLRRRALHALAFGGALLAGESAVAALPMAFAYATSQLGFRRGLRLMAPSVLVFALYAGFYLTQGYGVRGSGAYLDVTQPSLELAVELARRWLVLCSNAFGFLPADAWLRGSERLQIVLGLGGLALALAAFVYLSRQLESELSRRLRALLLGALVGLVPMCLGIPGTRLLVIPELALAAFLGTSLHFVVERWRQATGRLGLALLAGWVLVTGIAFDVSIRATLPLELRRQGQQQIAVAAGVAAICPGAVALAAVPNPMATYLPFISSSGAVRPYALHVLSLASGRHEIVARGDGAFELTMPRLFLGQPWARVFRREPLGPGFQTELHGVGLRVLEMGSRVRLGLELASGKQACWVTQGKNGSLVRLEPAPGRSLSFVAFPN